MTILNGSTQKRELMKSTIQGSMTFTVELATTLDKYFAPSNFEEICVELV